MAFITSPSFGLQSAFQHKLSSSRPLRRSACTLARRNARASLAEKFGHLRNADIPTVADTMNKFADAFGRPVPIVYRAIVNELITTTHLSIVCALWQYDVIFAYGFQHIFSTFLSFYPDENERERLRICICNSLGLDANKMESDAALVEEFVEGCKTSEELFEKVNNEKGIVIDGLKAPLKINDYEYYYSRCYGIGLISIMEKVGEEITPDTGLKWGEKLSLDTTKLNSEIGLYISSMERLKQAESIFAQAAAREAKKTADRLADRAAAAQKKLEELERDETIDNNDEKDALEPIASSTSNVSDKQI